MGSSSRHSAGRRILRRCTCSAGAPPTTTATCCRSWPSWSKRTRPASSSSATTPSTCRTSGSTTPYTCVGGSSSFWRATVGRQAGDQISQRRGRSRRRRAAGRAELAVGLLGVVDDRRPGARAERRERRGGGERQLGGALINGFEEQRRAGGRYRRGEVGRGEPRLVLGHRAA